MSSIPSVAVVILNWNGKKYLEQFLPSVLSSTYSNYKVIVADNGSTDDSVDFITTQYPQVGIVRIPSNLGFTGGYNYALKQVHADYFVLLNSDVEVTPGWIEPIVELMEADTAIAACQPKVLSYRNKQLFEYAGAAGGWLDGFGYPFCRGRVFEVCETDEGQYNSPMQVFWASGAAMFIRHRCFEEAGGFDEYFFAHQEEIDLCWRLQLLGYKTYVQPHSVVYHLGGGTLPMGDKRKVYLNFRNNLIMLAKNLPLSEAWWKIPFRILMDISAGLKGLASGNVNSLSGIAKAHFRFFKWGFTERRRSSVKLRPTNTLTGVYSNLVLWDYYFRRNRRFSEIVCDKK